MKRISDLSKVGKYLHMDNDPNEVSKVTNGLNREENILDNNRGNRGSNQTSEANSFNKDNRDNSDDMSVVHTHQV